MFSIPKAAVAFLALVHFVSATITITNFNVTGNGTTSIQWSSSDPDTDPQTFTIEFGNPSFNTQFGVGNNIPTTDGSITFQTPSLIPGPDYTIRFVENNNDTNVFAQTQPFTVTEHDVASSTQAQISGTTSVSLVSVSNAASQSSGASTTGGASNGASATTPAPLPSGTSPSGTGSTSASASVFGGGSGGSGGGGNAAAGLSAPAALGVSAATLLAGVAAIMLA